MTDEEAYKELTRVFRDVFDDDEINLDPETTAADIPGWDSQTNITLVVATEHQFGIQFRTAEIERLRNVRDFVELIQAKHNRLKTL